MKCFGCLSGSSQVNNMVNRTTGAPIKFNLNELEELQKKYNFLEVDSAKSPTTIKTSLLNSSRKTWEFLA